MSLPQWSRRSDDGGARPSVQFLIAELERGMMGRGGNRANITGMNLGIVRTLLNHINKLEDRLDELEGRIGATVPATNGVQANIPDTHSL